MFNPWFRRGVARSHRKIAVIDGETAFVGGINTNDDSLCDYAPYKPLPAPRWDFAVRVRGPLVDRGSTANPRPSGLRAGHLNLKHRYPPVPRNAQAAAGAGRASDARRLRGARQPAQPAHHPARLPAGDRPRAQAGADGHAVFRAGRKFREALAQAAQRGVDVCLLIGVGEFRMQDAVANSFYPQLLAAGVRIVEYRKTQLHAKVAVVDHDWATVGSSNCDGLSLFVNQEANVVVRDAGFAASMASQIERGIADGVPVGLDDLRQLGWVRRAGHEMAYLLYKLTMRIFAIGYA
jgi:cardiolipin synthase